MMKKILCSLTLLLAVVSVFASDFVKPMNGKMVSDYAGIFNSQELSELETALRNFNDTTSTQIAVLTVNDLNGYDAADYAIRTAEEWGIGQKGKNNGVLFLVKPKNATRGEVFIAVGYGLEGVIPDAIAKRIINQAVIPYFKQNDYYSGVKAGVVNLMGLASGEFTADNMPNAGGKADMYIGIFTFLFIFIVSLFKRPNSTTIGNNDYNRHHRPVFWGMPIYGGGSSSSSGFGGGGFGGFSGGGFGGGGAGGSW